MQPDDKFKFFFEELTRVYEGFTKFTISMSLALLGVAGWFFTSASIDKVLGKTTLAVTGIVTLVLTAGIELGIMLNMIRMFRKLDGILRTAAANIGFDRDHYKHRIFTWHTIIAFYLFHLALIIVLIEMIIQKMSQGNI